MSKVAGIGGIKTDIIGDIHSSPNLEMLGKEVDSLFVKDKTMTPVPVTSKETSKQSLPHLQEEINRAPQKVPKAKENENVFAFSDRVAKTASSQEYETGQKGHSAKNISQEKSLDGTVSTQWEGVNQEHTSYKAKATEKWNSTEITSKGLKGEFESHVTITKEPDGTNKEVLYIKNNKDGTETSGVIETKGQNETCKGNVKSASGDSVTYEIEKAGGQVLHEFERIEFFEGGIEIMETVKDIEQQIKTMAFFSDSHMEELAKINFTEREAIEVLAKNIREGKISTAKIKKEIMTDDKYLTSMFEEGALLELIEQEYAMSLDEENMPKCSRLTKQYDKSGNLIGEEEETTYYRPGESENEREHVIVRKTFDISEDKRIQTGEEEFIDCYDRGGEKNIQFSKTFFQYGRKTYLRIDRIQKGTVSEEYKDLGGISEAGSKMLFARLLEGKPDEISITHHADIFYNEIEEEDREIRTTIYKALKNPDILLARIDLLQGYSASLPLWVLTVSEYSDVNTQFFPEGLRDTTFIDRFDKTNGYHSVKATLKGVELQRTLMREITGIMTRMDEEGAEKRIKEHRSHLEYRFADRAIKRFNVYTVGWMSLNTSRLKWMDKNNDICVAEVMENINYNIIKYFNTENKMRRESSLDRRHTFLPIIISAESGLEILLGYKYGTDLIFLLWEMLNIVGQAEGEDRFASVKI